MAIVMETLRRLLEIENCLGACIVDSNLGMTDSIERMLIARG